MGVKRNGIKYNDFGCFDGVDIFVSDYLPDNQMFVNKKTFAKMAKWFDDNTPMKEIKEAGEKRPTNKGVPCSPGCQGHVSHPCEKCGQQW